MSHRVADGGYLGTWDGSHQAASHSSRGRRSTICSVRRVRRGGLGGPLQGVIGGLLPAVLAYHVVRALRELLVVSAAAARSNAHRVAAMAMRSPFPKRKGRGS